MTTISHYAATMHENPSQGNGLPYDEAVRYNERKRVMNGDESSNIYDPRTHNYRNKKGDFVVVRGNREELV